MRDFIAKQVIGLHRLVYDASGGRIGGDVAGMRVLELTTTGAKSGKPRTAMLTSPTRHEGNMIVVASRGGDSRHPGWYHNLVANPDVEVKVGSDVRSMKARVVGPEERAELWPKVTAAYRGYAGYQTKTEREIPLVVLEPV